MPGRSSGCSAPGVLDSELSLFEQQYIPEEPAEGYWFDQTQEYAAGLREAPLRRPDGAVPDRELSAGLAFCRRIGSPDWLAHPCP
jgi:hypothetical protein